MSEYKKFSNYRWTVCALIFFATTVNYLDRQVIGILKPLLESDLGIGEKDYSHIIMAFQLLYAVGMFIAGRLIDKFGTKIGYGVSVILWSIAAMGHALAKGVWGFGFWRGFLGISEAGNFPAANKSIAEWFPKKERALAFGIMNSGTNVGAIVAPLAIPAMIVAWSWQAAFIITGAIGFIWVILWFIFYEVPEKHKKISAGELAYINSDVDEQNETKEKIPQLKLLKYRQTWLFFIGKGLTDPIWWFYLFWIPGWLSTVRGAGLSISSFGLPLAFIYTMTTVGSIGGGWVSGLYDQERYVSFQSKKNDHAYLCTFGRANNICTIKRSKHMGCSLPYCSCSIITPGMVSQPLYHCIRCLSKESSKLDHRNRRNGRCCRRCFYFIHSRRYTPAF